MARADGKKLKGLTAMTKATAMFMAQRTDAMNMITIDVPFDSIREYVNKRRFENPTSHMAVIVAAYIRTVSQFPELNRFVVNKTFYARNELTVSMVVLQKGGDSHGTMNKMYFNPDDTIDEVTEKINKYIEDNSDVQNESNATDKALEILSKIPGFFRIGIPIVKWADKHGFLPKSVIDASPFHASLLITNLSSIRTNHIYHHVYEFGTTSISIAMGNSRYKTEKKGKEFVTYRTIPLGLTMDERIASGSYFALAFKQFEKYCKHPEFLEVKPEKVVSDPNI